MPQFVPRQQPSLARLIACNPHLTLADILALWHWSGPSRRLH